MVGIAKPLLLMAPRGEPAGDGVAPPGTEEGAPGQPLPGEGVAILVRPDMGVVDGGTGDGTGSAGIPGAPAVEPGVGDWVAAREPAPAVRMTVTAPMD